MVGTLHCEIEIMLSKDRSIFGLFQEFWNRILEADELAGTLQIWDAQTYARHQLEDRCLCLPEQSDHFLKTFEQGVVISHCPCHTSCKTITKIVIDIEFTWRARSEEGIVET